MRLQRFVPIWTSAPHARKGTYVGTDEDPADTHMYVSHFYLSLNVSILFCIAKWTLDLDTEDAIGRDVAWQKNLKSWKAPSKGEEDEFNICICIE